MHNYFGNKRKYIELDVQKVSSWILLHQALCHTFAHFDADGYVTWVQVLSGYKFWSFLQPKGQDKFKSCKQYFDAITNYRGATPTAEGFYGPESDRVIIYAGPGDISKLLQLSQTFTNYRNSIQPPGSFHEVYMPIPSVATGGHFFFI